MHRTTLTVTYESVRQATIVERSVGVEVPDLQGDRSEAQVTRDGSTVTVDVRASDLVALRASQNTWLSLLDVAAQVADR